MLRSLNSLFGGTSVPKVTPQDRAILDLKLQRDKLRQYQKKIQGVLDREYAIAKQHMQAGHKDRAVIALRRRKYQESLLQKTDAQMENLEQLVATIEFSLVEVSVLHGLKQGNEVLKEIHKEMNVDSVEKLLEETHEAQEYQREVNRMLADTLTLDEEDAVQDELKQLEDELIPAAKVPALPNVPQTLPESPDALQTPVEERTERVAIPA